MPSCGLCGDDVKVVYEGDIRAGSPGTTTPATIYGCSQCGVQQHFLEEPDDYYESGQYRLDVGQDLTPETFTDLHDGINLRHRFPILSNLDLRGKVIADIGCGGGSLLDAVAGLAATTVAIEPTTHFHRSLAERGHKTYGSVPDALADDVRADIVMSFSVIEHVQDPIEFAMGLAELAAPGARVIVGTPNLRDLCLEVAPGYPTFWYRRVHRFYFGHESLAYVFQRADLQRLEVAYAHDWGFGNFLGWTAESQPRGDVPSPLGKDFDALWRAELIRTGRSSYIVMSGTKSVTPNP